MSEERSALGNTDARDVIETVELSDISGAAHLDADVELVAVDVGSESEREGEVVDAQGADATDGDAHSSEDDDDDDDDDDDRSISEQPPRKRARVDDRRRSEMATEERKVEVEIEVVELHSEGEEGGVGGQGAEKSASASAAAVPSPPAVAPLCPICADALAPAVGLPCGHLFCGDCVYRALSFSTGNTATSVGKCPLCRQDVPLSKLTWLKVRRRTKPQAPLG